MQRVLRLTHRFGSINAQYQINKSRNAVRFEAQNLLWDYNETNYHTTAFSKGLASLQFQAGTSNPTQETTSSSKCLPASRPNPSSPKPALPTWAPTSSFPPPALKPNSIVKSKITTSKESFSNPPSLWETNFASTLSII